MSSKKLSFKKILVTGLPGSGKSTLSEKLALKLDAIWLNADKVRGEVNDWDFSYEGRLRQTKRMKLLADDVIKNNKNVIADFVCPTPETRKDFCPDITIWVDTIKKGKFEDTNKMFIPPKKFDFHVTHKDAEIVSDKIAKKIIKLNSD